MVVTPCTNTDSLPRQLYSAGTKSDQGWVWYDPPQQSPPVTFCLETSLHGLRYVGQAKRHVLERVIWIVAFLASVTTAIVLILHMWTTYKNMPIITVFTPSDKKIDEIPFPSVTVCNVNTIQKSKRDNLVQQANEYIKTKDNDRHLLETLADLLDVYHVCNSTPSFFDRFVESYPDDMSKIFPVMVDRKNDYEPFLDPIRTLRSLSQPCSQMIPLCIWRGTIANCTELFKEVKTDFGNCCTFNMIPASLLLRNKYINDIVIVANITVTGCARKLWLSFLALIHRNEDYSEEDLPERTQRWKSLDITTDNLMFTENNEDREYPDRQLFAGRSAGLSFLLNPELDEYFCTNTDSEGFVLGINIPLDYPRMKDNGIAVSADAEVFLSMRPEITLADSTTKQFPLQKRECYFSHEYDLAHYTKYTKSNCIADCITNKTWTTCGCLRFYMPHDMREKDMLCKPENYTCTDNVKVEIVGKGLDAVCRKCLQSCNNIVYHTEITSLPLREKKAQDLLRKYTQMASARKLSVVHVYFNVDSTYPRIRKEMSTIIELISNAGGLLGLCMGFSMLSLLEIIYHATIRLICSSYFERSKSQFQHELVDSHAPVSKDVQTEFLVKAFHYTVPKNING